MPNKRIIPCLDVKDGRVVKGTNFLNLKDAGDPVELALAYERSGADELILLDIGASTAGSRLLLELVRQMAKQITIPFTVGGGLQSLGDISLVLASGASKVSLNTAAVQNPELVFQASRCFGSPCLVVAIDAYYISEGCWKVAVQGGHQITEKNVLAWASRVEKLGAGEILLTAINRDGTRDGYDLKLTAAVSQAVSIPVIASGGVGTLEHLYEGLTIGGANAVLAASIFHFGTYTIAEAKRYLTRRGVSVC